MQLQRANEIQTDQSKGKVFNNTKVRIDTLEEANIQMQILVESLQQENKTLVQTTGQQVESYMLLVVLICICSSFVCKSFKVLWKRKFEKSMGLQKCCN